MLLYLTLSHRRWKAEGKLHTQEDLCEAIVDGAARRIRPKLMTVLTMMIGLVPVLWSNGTGADVMKRIAAPMVGGPGDVVLARAHRLPGDLRHLEEPGPAEDNATRTTCTVHRRGEPRVMINRRTLPAVVVSLLALASCKERKDAPSTGTGRPPELPTAHSHVEIAVTANGFEPAKVAVEKGACVARPGGRRRGSGRRRPTSRRRGRARRR
jgi:hypothetical protein